MIYTENYCEQPWIRGQGSGLYSVSVDLITADTPGLHTGPPIWQSVICLVYTGSLVCSFRQNTTQSASELTIFRSKIKKYGEGAQAVLFCSEEGRGIFVYLMMMVYAGQPTCCWLSSPTTYLTLPRRIVTETRLLSSAT